MSMQDLISDMLTRIRNAYRANLDCVSVLFSNINLSVLMVLKKNGFIRNYKIVDVDVSKNKKLINVTLKYYNGVSVIRGIKRISKPSCRIYARYSKLPKIMNGFGISVVSTSCGVVSDNDARKIGVGGEIICNIW